MRIYELGKDDRRNESKFACRKFQKLTETKGGFPDRRGKTAGRRLEVVLLLTKMKEDMEKIVTREERPKSICPSLNSIGVAAHCLREKGLVSASSDSVWEVHWTRPKETTKEETWPLSWGNGGPSLYKTEQSETGT